MEENNYKPQIPDVMEAIFDAAYLIFDLVAAILFFTFSKGNILFVLYGILTLTLCGGDAFHLVPRIIRAVRGSDEKIKRQLGIGLQVSSVTMTVFYIILMCLEIYISGNDNTDNSGSGRVDISGCQNCDMHVSTEQLVYR